MSVPLKFRIVCATRVAREAFATQTALGRSLSLFPYGFIELRLFASNVTGLPVLYNTVIREAQADPAILIFIHDDVHLIDLFWPNHIASGLGLFDVLGVAGSRRRLPGQPAWCFQDTGWKAEDRDQLSGIVGQGTSWPPSLISFYGPTGQRVVLLDGLLLACRSETLLSRNIWFDERFDFHLYDLDFCRQAEMAGLRLGTWSISLLHESTGVFGGPAWRAAYDRYLDKWRS